jgi:MFS superfamily sulfate permease-like transporter
MQEMTKTKKKHALTPRTSGMRFSWQDSMVFAITALITWFFWEKWSTLIFTFIVVLAHFFLFCNVFRIHRQYELIWASFFVVNYSCWVLSNHFSWLGILLTQLPITVILILLGIRHPTYHGIFARICNSKNIDRYLRGEI